MKGGKSSKVVKFTGSAHASREPVLEKLYRDHGRELINFIRQRTRKVDEEPEDIAQEVFLRLARRGELLDNIEQGTVNKRPYLFSMANNLVVDLERRKTRLRKYKEAEQDHFDPDESLVIETPESLMVLHGEVAIFKQVIAELKPAWRKAFLLNRFKYMSYQQISTQMGATVKQVENYIAQALVRLRAAQEQLDKQGEQP